ncbi:MAG: gliding motility-associated C-terminal domain-containing protein [Bacteroidales bacterium]
MFRKLVFSCIIFIFSMLEVFATHQRAAEITYTWINDLTYEFTITMYTFTPSPADDTRLSLAILWGDNTGSDIPRITFSNLGNDYTLNVYQMRHTFPASGTYKISVEDPNRNLGVVNIPNSVNVPMYVETQLVINPFLGNNNSVMLLNPPIDQACVGSVFVHNPAAFDPDGDSLSYKLVNCRGLGGLEIPGFTLPMSSVDFSMDSVSGNLIWETPVLQGEYNIAFVVEEWRFGVRIGTVERDMQIVVGACNNQAPIITSITDTCVIAGDTLQFVVSATDPDGNGLSMTANGGPFEMADHPAFIYPDPASGTPTVTTTFTWETICSHIRNPVYVALFRARDAHPVVSLTSLKAISIRVIGPPVELISVVALGNGADLDWNTYTCENAVGYKVYRRSGSYGYPPDACQTGVPAGSGYYQVGQTESQNDLHFRDEGLIQGIDYCYVITAVFPDGAESLMSNEMCVTLKRDLPVMTHVSNDSLNLSSGNVLTAWSKPVDLDTNQFPGPYIYKLIRYEGLTGGNPVQVFTGGGLNDTLFVDESVNLNSSGIPYRYLVQLESESIGLIGSSQSASSVFLETIPGDEKMILKWNPLVPWINDSAQIFRKTADESVFSYIGISGTKQFTDAGLQNEQRYCYYVKTIGGYSVPGIIHPINNFSQIICDVPLDNIPPCPPVLQVSTDCDQSENLLHWNVLPDTCTKGIVKYLIYFKQTDSEDFHLIDSVFSVSDTSYLHQGLDFTVGCYYLQAVDENGNISLPTNTVCVDYTVCPAYDLPNVFTPNSDNYNDIFYPKGYPESNPAVNIQSVSMIIFNRWGRVVFETQSPEIAWDGKEKQTGSDCPEGVYFYTCDLNLMSLNGLVELHLQGSITIIR